MPDQKFLDRLHDDPPAVEPEHLPDSMRDSYVSLLDACAEARAEDVAPDVAGCVRARLARPLDRVVKLGWLVAAAATVAVALAAWMLTRPQLATPHMADEGDGRVTIRLAKGAKIRVGPAGREVTLAELGTWLDGENRLEDVNGVQLSKLRVTIHADPDTNWRGLKEVLEVLAKQRIQDVWLSVSGKIVDASLPTDRGLNEPRRDIKVQVRIVMRHGTPRYGFGDQESERLERVAEWLRQSRVAARGAEVVGEIEAAHDVRHADVVALLELFRREKIERVEFRGGAKHAVTPETLHAAARQRMENEAAATLARLRALAKDRIIVVTGDFDQPDRWFDLYEIPHTQMRPDGLLAAARAQARLIVLPCMRTPGPVKRDKLAGIIRRFVEGGGWLISSDWAAGALLQHAFPGRLGKVGPRKLQPDTTVAPDSLPAARWWLEESSAMVGPLKDARVLIRSTAMGELYGSDVLACEFTAGEGRVLHLVGHVHARDGNVEGILLAHRLLVKFLGERFPP